jgi:g-D-glutamyl-meso-diaminopimelate peptidase
MDHSAMMAILDEFVTRYPGISVTVLGQSIMGRAIPMVHLGASESTSKPRRVLYLGAHHGMEWITASVLLRFINEYCELLRSDGMAEGIRVKRLEESREIDVVPMLNPDGVEYAIHGVSADNPLRDRLLRMNGGSVDFSHWQANARGVDLNHNYNAGFEEYKRLEAENGILGGAPTRYSGEGAESEPETRALCDFIRYHHDLLGVMTLHTQGEEIFFCNSERTPMRIKRIADRLSSLCGYRLADTEGLNSFGGLTDWCVQERKLPAFTVECGKGENPLPFSDFRKIYTTIRRMLHTFPLLL